ncbi:MAG: DNA polymerase III subunit beta [Clostridia bacterium]|nr:DNA polymerase III subunit beta [Clostridia bacterium]MBQ2255513.1 DNA polymerase III subunit beta [Clostridia bacterium]MBQ5793716.1 DNA polymerase III subunit beta [Clostridia bacterium]
MKIVFNRQEICNAVTPLMCAVSGKSTLTAVEGILFEAKEDNTCVLTTFDLEKGVRLTIQAQVEQPGSYIINAQKFVQTIRVMEGETVTLTVNDKLNAEIVSAKSSHKMNALSGADFPEIPRLTSQNGFKIRQSVLKDMLSKVMYAMGVNDQRPVLNGCHFKIAGTTLHLVSCDSFKLAKCNVTTDIEAFTVQGNSDFSFIIPSKTVGELYRMLENDEDATVTVYTSRKNIVFDLDHMIFFSRLIDGEYIDYNRIIMTNHRITVELDRAVLIGALERAALVTEERIAGSVRSHVKLTVDGDFLKISATSTAGSTYEELAIDHEGDDLVIAFNNRYLIDSLRSCTADRIRLSMTSALSSINIEPAVQSEDKELFLLLPVRMKD